MAEKRGITGARRRTRQIRIASLIASAVSLAAVSSTLAAATLGQTGASPVACDGPASYVQTTTGAPPGYQVPAGGGVITAWSTAAGIGGAQAKLAVLRPTGETNQFFTAGASAVETLEGRALNSFATNIPVEGGDLLGVLIISGTHNCLLPTTPNPNDRGVREVGTVFDAGSTGTYSEPSQPGRRLNLVARVEVDADGDLVGDEVPRTKINKGAPKRTGHTRVGFEFSSDDPGASFECRLDAKPYRACSSPLRITVAEGKHEFSVRARDADGHRDRSAATDGFKVVPRG